MRTRHLPAFVGLATLPVLLLAVAPVSGQTNPASTRPPSAAARPQPAPPARPSVVAIGGIESWWMSSSESFETLFDTSRLTVFGGGIEGRHLWRGLFVRGAFWTTSEDGERVYIDDGEVFPLGIPLEVTLTPIELSAGWRFGRPSSRIVPYAGAGVVFLQYKETSSLGEEEEDVDESTTGYVAFGGVEFAVSRWLGVGVEAHYRGIADILGDEGVSAYYGEDSLGGFTARVFVAVGPRWPRPAAPATPGARPRESASPLPTRSVRTDSARSGPVSSAPGEVVAPRPLREDLPASVPGFLPPAPVYEATIEVIVDADGGVSAVKVLESNNARVDYYVATAARNWRYEPARRAGQAVAYRRVVAVSLEPR